MWKTFVRRPTALLIALGLLSTVAYLYVGWGLDGSSRPSSVYSFLATFAACFLLYGIGVVASRSARGGAGGFLVVLLFAVVFRLLLLPAGLAEPKLERLEDDLTARAVGYQTFLLYDNDLWRHLWEAHALAHGYSPYAHTPAELAAEAWEEGPAESLFREERWRDLYDNISFNDYSTVYPPTIQWTFLGLEKLIGGTLGRAKLLLIALDLGAVALLSLALGQLGRRPVEVLSYAWNPLLIKEIAGSGHAEAIVLFALAATLWLWTGRRYRAAMVALAVATMAKLSPVILVPLLARRAGWRSVVWFAAAAAALVAPFAADLARLGDGLAVYGRDWVFNSGVWAAARELLHLAGSSHPALGAHLLTKAAFGLALIWIWTRDKRADTELIRDGGRLLALLVLLHPAVMPWYVLWALPFVCLAGGRTWLIFSALCLLSYIFYVHGTIPRAVLWLEYSAFAAAGVGLHLLQRERPSTP